MWCDSAMNFDEPSLLLNSLPIVCLSEEAWRITDQCLSGYPTVSIGHPNRQSVTQTSQNLQTFLFTLLVCLIAAFSLFCRNFILWRRKTTKKIPLNVLVFVWQPVNWHVRGEYRPIRYHTHPKYFTLPHLGAKTFQQKHKHYLGRGRKSPAAVAGRCLIKRPGLILFTVVTNYGQNKVLLF